LRLEKSDWAKPDSVTHFDGIAITPLEVIA